LYPLEKTLVASGEREAEPEAYSRQERVAETDTSVLPLQTHVDLTRDEGSLEIQGQRPTTEDRLNACSPEQEVGAETELESRHRPDPQPVRCQPLANPGTTRVFPAQEVNQQVRVRD